ncbi:clusterin [Sander vitreus]
MLMMMMMMKKKGSKFLAVVALLLVSANCILLPSKEELTQISLLGEKYLDKQIENAVNGVKEMKSVMKKSSEEHQKFLDALEKTKEQKEEALRVAQEKEAKLEQEEEVCNETMTALWEECKPCLKNTCVKYYSRTCSSGSGLVGRQLEEVLNRTSPFSIWINGENIDTLQQEGQRQSKELRNLEEKYSEMADGVDSIFSDSMKVADHVHYNPPVFFFPNFLEPYTHRSRTVRSLFLNPFHGFQDLFSPMKDMSRNFFSSMGSMMDIDSDAAPNEDGSVNEDVVITKPFGNGRMTCREIRRNSAGCLKFREECQKCKEIQHIDCSGKRPLEGPLKQELEEALAMAERFTQQYNSLLKTFEEKMFNTSSILDLLNREFGWVSSLANNTNTKDDIFKVQTVNSRDTEEKPSEGEKNQPGETNVSVQLFDNPPVTFSVPGDIPWTDPKFSEVVAQKALDRYKETSVVVK